MDCETAVLKKYLNLPPSQANLHLWKRERENLQKSAHLCTSWCEHAHWIVETVDCTQATQEMWKGESLLYYIKHLLIYYALKIVKIYV